MAEIGRRSRIDLLTGEEFLIRASIKAIEEMPHAHPLLTEAQTLLMQAQSKLADWVDEHRP